MLNATVVKREEVTDSLIILGVKPDQEIPDFEPGQYVALGLYASAPRIDGTTGLIAKVEAEQPDKLLKRTYSIGSSPVQKEFIEFYIALVPDGLLTPRLALLRDGDRVYMAPKITGKFVLSDVPEKSNLVMVSTGTGIAPFISMLKTPATWEKYGQITLLHGVRYQEDLAYREELEAFERDYPNFKYLATVSRPKEGWSGIKGYVQHFFERGEVSTVSSIDHVFLCGNPAMVDEVEKSLCLQGYTVHSSKNPQGSLHLEKYW